VNFGIAQSGDPNVSLQLASCVQFNEKLCVRGINYCPDDPGTAKDESLECVGMMSVSPFSSYLGNPGAWLDVPGAAIGANRYLAQMWLGGSFVTESLFTNKYERDLFVCMARGYEGKILLQAKLFVPVNEAVYEALSANGDGLFTAKTKLLSPAGCIAELSD